MIRTAPLLMVSNKETVTKLTLGSAVYTVTKNDETGEEIKTITGYYGMLSGRRNICVLSRLSAVAYRNTRKYAL